jgi:hypothetical protein
MPFEGIDQTPQNPMLNGLSKCRYSNDQNKTVANIEVCWEM